MLSEYRDYSLVDFERLRRKIEFKVSVGDFMFGEDRLNRKPERRVALARSFKVIQRAIVAPLQERKQSDVPFNARKRYRLSGCFCLFQGLFEKPFSRFKLVQQGVSVSEAIVDRRKLFLIVECSKT